jgi:hypothetical protein
MRTVYITKIVDDSAAGFDIISTNWIIDKADLLSERGERVITKIPYKILPTAIKRHMNKRDNFGGCLGFELVKERIKIEPGSGLRLDNTARKFLRNLYYIIN